MDTPATPASQVNTEVASNTPEVKALPADPKAASAPVDQKAADSIKVDTKAEKEVIKKIKLGDTDYDETTLLQMIEKAKGADKKFLESSRMKKEAVKFFKLAKENPEEFLSKTGTDPKKWSYEKVAKDIQDKLRDPRDVENERLKAENETFKKKQADEEAKIRADKETKETAAWKAKFEVDIITALEAHPALPKNGFTVAKVAQYISTVRDKTGVLLSASEVAGVIERDIRSEIKGMVTGASAEQLLELIGEEGINAIRKFDLAKLKDPLKNGTSASNPSGDKPKEKKWKDSKEFWKTIKQDAKRERGEI